MTNKLAEIKISIVSPKENLTYFVKNNIKKGEKRIASHGTGSGQRSSIQNIESQKLFLKTRVHHEVQM